MSRILCIASRDFKALVASPIFYIIGIFCSAIWSYSFLRKLIEFAQMSSLPPQMQRAGNLNIHYQVFVDHISLINLIFIFAIPAITMRLVSEEKQKGTYDLLLTSPISSLDIVVGKFLAGFSVAMLLVATALLYPLGTEMFADFNYGPLFSSFLGVTFLTASYVAIGVFASTLTQSTLLSVILGVLMNLTLWLVSQLAGTDNELLSKVVEHISIPHQFYGFIKGTISTNSLVFFTSAVAFFLFLSQRIVESSRWR